MLVRRNEEQASRPHRTTKPVVVLCNEGLVQARRNFLNAFEKLPQVTFGGTPVVADGKWRSP